MSSTPVRQADWTYEAVNGLADCPPTRRPAEVAQSTMLDVVPACGAADPRPRCLRWLLRWRHGAFPAGTSVLLASRAALAGAGVGRPRIGQGLETGLTVWIVFDR